MVEARALAVWGVSGSETGNRLGAASLQRLAYMHHRRHRHGQQREDLGHRSQRICLYAAGGDRAYVCVGGLTARKVATACDATCRPGAPTKAARDARYSAGRVPCAAERGRGRVHAAYTPIRNLCPYIHARAYMRTHLQRRTAEAVSTAAVCGIRPVILFVHPVGENRSFQRPAAS